MTEHDRSAKLVRAYEHMLERVREWAENFEDKSVESLEKVLDEAKEKVEEVEELTREEADAVKGFVKRDLAHLADHLKLDKDLKDWLYIDLTLIEDELLDLLSKVADPTTVELLRLKELAELADYYKTGEVTGPGVLECVNCGERLHFTRPAHIPPCPKCHGTLFRRVTADSDSESGNDTNAS
ncbi:MAG: hypothetical protein D6717_06320 [Gammaproteobacteria bacterium]|nr:MAG: hypothetical protein D6717_06320 [Gammaproteobacteria bacterium]